MYELFFRLILRHIDPERAHALARRALQILCATPVGRAITGQLVPRPDQSLATHALGLTFSSPVGVAAGVDKDASWFQELGMLGFGFVEVGTVTARPQEGNPKPRVTRLVRARAILNMMGFPNPGAEVVARRLRRSRSDGDPIVGVNIGKSKAITVEDAGSDYRSAVRQLGPLADYLVLNVSSPNTPGLRAMQATDALSSLVADVRTELVAIARAVPLLVKVAPDLDDDQLMAIGTLAVELGLSGIVAVNTTVDRAVLGEGDRATAPFAGGGVSGAPLRSRAIEVLRRLRATTGDKLVLISVGGVEDAEDVWERILAGATLVQVYTAFVYGGPGWPARVNRELARRLREAGLSSIQDLAAVNAPPPPRRCTPDGAFRPRPPGPNPSAPTELPATGSDRSG